MYVNNAVSNLIRENNTSGINNVIQTGLIEGMTTMERSVIELYEKGVISKEAAADANRQFFQAPEDLSRQAASEIYFLPCIQAVQALKGRKTYAV